MTLTKNQKQLLDLYECRQMSDFLFVYPFRYEEIIGTDERLLQINDRVVIEGQIITPIQRHFYQKNRSVSRFKFLSAHNEYLVTIFNRPWLKTPAIETKCTIIGKLQKPGNILASNVYFKELAAVAGIEPIYPLKKNATQRSMKALMKKAWTWHIKEKEQLFVEGVLESPLYMDFNEALKNIHFPQDSKLLTQAIQTIKYAEFFMYHLRVLLNSELAQGQSKIKKVFDASKIAAFIDALPYQLSTDQKTSIQEILGDLKSEKTMMRLLQGDVGSGKTIVALISALATIDAGYQVAFLAPTELLATQHTLNIKKQLAQSPIKVEFLASSLPTKVKNELLERLENHDIDLIIGTHAIFQEHINFKKLGLVITDEQHRFGVLQRHALISKGEHVDVLSMSATPIPRTLANALFSELDISSIMTMPSNRGKIITHLIQENSLMGIMDDLIDEMQAKHQVYVICPAITQGQLNTRNVETVYENLVKVYGKQFKIDMLHGQMDASIKEQTMQDFVAGHIDMLISTTVIEVGIDVANATRLVVYDADRFGLSQLHQLRGRIGRSHLESICYLLTKTKDSDTLKRLSLLEKYDSGFEIAYHDLITRGPGDIIGVKQSGLPSFSFGNVVDDQQLLLQAKEDAKAFLGGDLNENQKTYLEKLKKSTSADQTFID